MQTFCHPANIPGSITDFCMPLGVFCIALRELHTSFPNNASSTQPLLSWNLYHDVIVWEVCQDSSAICGSLRNPSHAVFSGGCFLLPVTPPPPSIGQNACPSFETALSSAHRVRCSSTAVSTNIVCISISNRLLLHSLLLTPLLQSYRQFYNPQCTF